MFDKILIANRGEIALRILRACKELGIATVAVHSTADADAMHVRLADESVCIGPPPARESYLNIPSLIAACEITGADAIHPGYGFLSENARFAEMLDEHGIAFIGPNAEHIRIMGDKIEAKRTASELGIPCVPGSEGGVTDDDEAPSASPPRSAIPVLIKAAAGGGGRGMKVAQHEAELSGALATARAEAKAAFGDDAVYLEKYLEQAAPHRDPGARRRARQRHPSRRARLLAAAPPPEGVGGRPLARRSTPREREQIGGVCRRRRCAKLGYLGAGTVEFLYEDGEFYFIEMNTRLQVEHPVTEMITGIDLVNEQIRIAAGAPLSLTQDEVTFDGHAIECRINAEDPSTFRPRRARSPTTIRPAGSACASIRAVYQGYRIPPYYDWLVGKLIVHGRTRTECLMRLRRALDEFVVDGIETTLPLFRALVRNPDIQNGALRHPLAGRFPRRRRHGRSPDSR